MSPRHGLFPWANPMILPPSFCHPRLPRFSPSLLILYRKRSRPRASRSVGCQRYHWQDTNAVLHVIDSPCLAMTAAAPISHPSSPVIRHPSLLAGTSPASRFPGLSSSVRYPGIAQSVQDSPRRCGADSPAPSAVVPESVGKATSVPPPYDFVLHYSVDSKWTKRIDFRSILVHFEIGTPSRPPSSVLPSSKKNCGKEKVKFWMLHQPLASLSFKHGKEMVKLLCSINGLDVV